MIRSHQFSAVLVIPAAIAHCSSIELLQFMKTAVLSADLTPVGETTATFEPQGVSAVLLLAESHVAVHIWTEECKATVDIHVCDFQQDNFPKAQTLATLLATNLTGHWNPTHWHTTTITT